MAPADPDLVHQRPRRLTRMIATTVTHVPALMGIAARHIGRDPWKAASVALRAAPAPVRNLFRQAAVRRSAPVLAIVADAAAGERETAVSALRFLVETGAPKQLRAAAAVSAILDRRDLAADAVDRLPANDSARLRVEALSAWAAGDVRRAVDIAQRSSRHGRGSLADGLAGELIVLQASEVSRLPERGAPPSRSARSLDGVGRSRPTVLHVVANALPEVQAGYTIRTQGIVAGQRGAGLDAHVVTRIGFPMDAGRIAPSAHFMHSGVPNHRLMPMRGVPIRADKRLQAGVEHLARLCRELGVDVLHAHSRHDNGQVALLAGARLGIPVVYEARGFLEETWRSRGGSADSDFYRLSRDAETACMRSSDAVVTVSGSMRANIVARGIAPAKVTIVGNAVAAEYLAPPPDATTLRAKLGILPQTVAVGMVSTLNDYEGVDVLLEAVALVDDPGMVALIVGDGPARQDLENMARRLLPEGRAIFTGRVPHAVARQHHAALDIFCVPRRRTSVTALVPPLKPIEAMATGRPIVVSDLPPLIEFVGPPQDGAGRSDVQSASAGHARGVVTTPDDPAAWASALSLLLYDPALRAQMGHAARRWVIEDRTWDAAADTYADLYARVLNSAQSGPGKDERVARAS